MKIQVILRTDGQPDAVVGEAEGSTLEEIYTETAGLFRDLVEEMEKGGQN